EVLVGDGAATLELRGRPVPAPADLLPALLVAAPAVEAGHVVTVGVERLDPARVPGHDLVHGGVKAGDRLAHALLGRFMRHSSPPALPPSPPPPPTGGRGDRKHSHRRAGHGSLRRRRKALAPSTVVVTPIRNVLTAAMVGSTSRVRLFQIRTV